MSLLPLVDFFKAEWPSSAAVWLPGGELPKPSQLFSTPAVANTYKRILAEAFAVVDKTGECCLEAELYRLKGELMLAQSSVLGLASSVQTKQKVKGKRKNY